MIKDEPLIRAYIDGTLSETETIYVEQRLKSDVDFKQRYDRIRMYYGNSPIPLSIEEAPQKVRIKFKPLPSKYTYKLKAMRWLRIVVIFTIVWLILHYFFGK